MSKYNDIRLKLQQDSQRVIDAYKTPSPEELTNIHNYALVVEHIEYIKYRASGINNKLKYKYVSGIYVYANIIIFVQLCVYKYNYVRYNENILII